MLRPVERFAIDLTPREPSPPPPEIVSPPSVLLWSVVCALIGAALGYLLPLGYIAALWR